MSVLLLAGLTGFTVGVLFILFVWRRSVNDMKQQIEKLRGQVYYWSRQIPVSAKRGRPNNHKSVK